MTDDRKTIEELCAMSEDERTAYFLAHPTGIQDPDVDPAFVARFRAKLLPLTRQQNEPAEPDEE